VVQVIVYRMVGFAPTERPRLSTAHRLKRGTGRASLGLGDVLVESLRLARPLLIAWDSPESSCSGFLGYARDIASALTHARLVPSTDGAPDAHCDEFFDHGPIHDLRAFSSHGLERHGGHGHGIGRISFIAHRGVSRAVRPDDRWRA
jgi:hypothetical protein